MERQKFTKLAWLSAAAVSALGIVQFNRTLYQGAGHKKACKVILSQA